MKCSGVIKECARLWGSEFLRHGAKGRAHVYVLYMDTVNG